MPVIVCTMLRDQVLRPDTCSNLCCHLRILPAFNVALAALHLPVLHCTLPAPRVDYRIEGVETVAG